MGESSVRRRGHFSPPRADAAPKKKDKEDAFEILEADDDCDDPFNSGEFYGETEARLSSTITVQKKPVKTTIEVDGNDDKLVENNEKSSSETPALDAALVLMKDEKFSEAAVVLEKIRAAMPEEKKNGSVLHNLGACYSELKEFDKAEVALEEAIKAFETQKVDPMTVNKTLYAMGSVMTEQGDPCKLAQAEMLLLHVLQSCDELRQRDPPLVPRKQHELSFDLYRSMVTLGQNLTKQKKWVMAADAWKQVVLFDDGFFKGCGSVAEHKEALERLTKSAKTTDEQRQSLIKKHTDDLHNAEKVAEHKAMYARAEKLARWQPIVRAGQIGLFIFFGICLVLYYFFNWRLPAPAAAEASTKEAL